MTILPTPKQDGATSKSDASGSVAVESKNSAALTSRNRSRRSSLRKAPEEVSADEIFTGEILSEGIDDICNVGDGDAPTTAGTMEMSDEVFVRHYKGLLPSVRKTTLDIAKLCAKKGSFRDERSTLRKCKLGPAKFSKYKKIGNDSRLNTILDRLPKNAGFTLLYEITRLDDEQFTSVVEKNVINPLTHRRSIERFSKGLPDEVHSKPSRMASIWVLPGTDRAEVEEILSALRAMSDMRGIIVDLKNGR